MIISSQVKPKSTNHIRKLSLISPADGDSDNHLSGHAVLW